ncbi:Alpha-N-acetylgalactosamine-specific lectin [Holothuria leucospilota]|uniref:Alpha-N-acetylgalactosamine-specific lectin n=1 Tax=Holothuria leucospilota TaxID=206669 RepID=A0A9Q1BQX9_HOLLE|nr:Alpha-N-acetylgalactosamine-specific lectin [Holothuria leucospilota]
MKIQLLALATTVALFSTQFANGYQVVCPDGWTHWKGGCYRFFNDPSLSWDDAETYCKKYALSCDICPDKTGHLAIIESEEENNFVFNFWKSVRPSPVKEFPQRVWIGFNDKEQEGNYIWVDGTPFQYSNWNPNQPGQLRESQDCGQMWRLRNSDLGKWNDFTCHEQLAFLCEFRCC